MIDLFPHYYNFPPEFFPDAVDGMSTSEEDSKLFSLLSCSTGRPYYFVNFVFSPMIPRLQVDDFLNEKWEIIKLKFLRF
jgi:hypothetical protein